MLTANVLKFHAKITQAANCNKLFSNLVLELRYKRPILRKYYIIFEVDSQMVN